MNNNDSIDQELFENFITQRITITNDIYQRVSIALDAAMADTTTRTPLQEAAHIASVSVIRNLMKQLLGNGLPVTHSRAVLRALGYIAGSKTAGMQEVRDAVVDIDL